MAKQVSDQEKAEIILLYKTGLSLEKVCEISERSRVVVRKIISKAGISRPAGGRIKPPGKKEKEAVALYESGLSILKVAGIVKLGTTSVRNAIIRSSKTRSPSESMEATKEHFTRKAQAVHGFKYDYSKVTYKNNHTKVTIICRDHGEFKQSPNSHISKSVGCQKCSYEATRSKGAQELYDGLIDLGIPFEEEATFPDLVNPETGRKLKIDFYSDEYNYAFEFDGEQHTKSSPLWEERNGGLEGTQERDEIKNNWCRENNIPLLRFQNAHRGTIRSHLKKFFGW